MSEVTVPITENSNSFVKVKDARGREIKGLWRRGDRFYNQMMIPGKGPRRVPLMTPEGLPVSTTSQAVAARAMLLANREKGELPGPRIAPEFSAYVAHYLQWLETTAAKSPLTIAKERSALKGWAKFLGTTRLNQITRQQINDYAVQRVTEGEVSNRAVNLDVIAFDNLWRFASDAGRVSSKSPTENWTPLKYKAPRRTLVSPAELDKLCAEALSTVGGKPKYPSGQFLADLLKFLAFSGARRMAALSAKWSQVDWKNRQLTLHTKFDKTVIVDFNEKLEAHLKDMLSRRASEDCPWIFPSPRSSAPGFYVQPHQIVADVAAACGMPTFHLHDLRSFFCSYCVMSGVDTLTISQWLGHSDGGVLIGKIYGYLNPKHKRDSAAKVRFTSEAPVQQQLPKATTLDLTKMSAVELLSVLQQVQALGLVPAAGILPQQTTTLSSPGKSTEARADESPKQIVPA